MREQARSNTSVFPAAVYSGNYLVFEDPQDVQLTVQLKRFCRLPSYKLLLEQSYTFDTVFSWQWKEYGLSGKTLAIHRSHHQQ